MDGKATECVDSEGAMALDDWRWEDGGESGLNVVGGEGRQRKNYGRARGKLPSCSWFPGQERC